MLYVGTSLAGARLMLAIGGNATARQEVEMMNLILEMGRSHRRKKGIPPHDRSKFCT